MSSGGTLAEALLNDIGSVLSILTFIYAVGIGLYLYLKTTANSSQEINEFLISLQFSFEEIRAFAHTYAINIEEIQASISNDADADAEAQALAAKAELIEIHTRNRLEALRKLALKVGTMANDSYFKTWTNRARFVLLQDELEKNVTGKDRLMDEMRRLQERFKQLEVERREQKQEDLMKRQIGLLEYMMKRLDRLEHNTTKVTAVVAGSDKSIASSDTTTANEVS